MDGVIVIQYLIVRQQNNFLLCGFHLKKYFDYSVLYCNVPNKNLIIYCNVEKDLVYFSWSCNVEQQEKGDQKTGEKANTLHFYL